MWHILRVPEMPPHDQDDSFLTFSFFLKILCQMRAILFVCFLKKQQLPNRKTNGVIGIAVLQKGFCQALATSVAFVSSTKCRTFTSIHACHGLYPKKWHRLAKKGLLQCLLNYNSLPFFFFNSTNLSAITKDV